MTDGVDTAMNGMQLPTLEARVDGAPPDTPIEQLTSRHKPVLPARDLGNQPIHPLQPTPPLGVATCRVLPFSSQS
jgi:hypothetical protein